MQTYIGRQAKGGVQKPNRLSASGIQTVLILGGLIMNMRYLRIFRFTLRAAEIFLVILCKECLHAVFAELQAGSFIGQHEAEHHLDRQQQGMKIPHDGGPLP